MITPSIFTQLINSYLPEPHASLLNGILFGINLKTTKLFYDELRIVGLLHIVVLSGMNISIIAGFVSSLSQNLGKHISLLITILTIILFIVFVGPQAPIIRAGIMAILTFVAIFFGRKSLAIYSMVISLIVIAIVWPKWLTTISLFLSYGATLGIIFFGQTSNKNQLIKDLRITLAAQVFTTPIIFLYFKQISLISPLSNLLISPVIAPLMVFGFVTAVLGRVNYFLGLIPAYICYGLLSYMVFVIETLSKIPLAMIRF